MAFKQLNKTFFKFYLCLFSILRPKEQKALYSFSTVTKLPNNIRMGQVDSSLPGSAARQHYLSQSRYLPGTAIITTVTCETTIQELFVVLKDSSILQ